MTAVEFIRKFGWSKAVEICKSLHKDTVGFSIAEKVSVGVYEVNSLVDTNDLKQYVDAWELVESMCGLEFAKGYIKQTGPAPSGKLEKAIELVEQVNENY